MHKLFDRSRLRLKPLDERVHDVTRDVLVYPDSPYERSNHPALPILAARVRDARRNSRPVILMLGAHVLRRGAAPLLIDLMERGLVTHLALNGAGAIHDYELALAGSTCESVARYVRSGEFGLWTETGGINDAAICAQREGIGFGEAIGKAIVDGGFRFAETSLLAAGYRLGVPVTVHVAIGQDIVHEHPNFDAAATGAASYTDFLVFTESVSGLEGGVLLNVGTAVMGPEVYLKALAMARNVAHQEGREIRHFTTGVFDLLPLDEEGLHREAPRTDPRYYFRPYKTILVRTVADGGESHYVQGDHRYTVPTLYHLILEG
ncbi:MAG TPA: hypothetical protein PKK95_07185 [Vicinamibacterales bacterium]|jgi:hypothetical protein|nr:hypothetical protein [Acidobacteriota bacterium]HOC18033.1 hypothetical protein [Vicinamibacterales bacterium]